MAVASGGGNATSQLLLERHRVESTMYRLRAKPAPGWGSLTTYYLLLTTFSLFTTSHLLRTSYYLLLTTFRLRLVGGLLLLTTYYLLLTTNYLLLTTSRLRPVVGLLLLTTYYLLLLACARSGASYYLLLTTCYFSPAPSRGPRLEVVVSVIRAPRAR